jgi:squalene-hopene/tetraprenyl-beta-curcumene cyclase
MRISCAIIAISCLAATLAGCSQSKPARASGSWDPAGAAAYLDRRIKWWMAWDKSARDRGTFCFSCHTAVSYAMARGALRPALDERSAGADERKLTDDVTRRVRLWSETQPFYPDRKWGAGKGAESRGTEAVLSALMLAWDDARVGRLSDDTRAALEHMWAVQLTDGDGRGAWSWLNFDLAPWEVPDSQYYGAALAALTVGVAPGNYRASPQIQDHLGMLRDYLARAYPEQSLHHHLILLWASAKLPGLLDAERRHALIEEALRAQNPDGGWSLSALITKTTKRGPLLRDAASDGYATALAALVLEQTAMPGAAAEVQRGRMWLVRNQGGHGGMWVRGNEQFWVTSSLNKVRNPTSDVGRFMSDAATAYAVLALTTAPATEPVPAAVRR